MSNDGSFTDKWDYFRQEDICVFVKYTLKMCKVVFQGNARQINYTGNDEDTLEISCIIQRVG